MLDSRYFLRTDIGQFYPSLYTHSIPWALHGKTYAKAHMNQTVGDEIDKAIRDQQSGQTVGVPIGPDTSLVVAEVVLTAVDRRLAPLQTNGFRYVDDYEFGFRSLSAAESALSDVQAALAEYELALNPRKTKVVEGPVSLEERWILELSRFPFKAGTSASQLNDAVAFFSRAFELVAEYPQQPIIRYAMVSAQRWSFPTAGSRTYQGLVFRALSADPGALPQGVALLAKHVANGGTINKVACRAVLESIIERHAPIGHGSEVAWALWMAIQFEIPLSAATAAHISTMEDDIVALTALDAISRQVFPANTVNTGSWQALASLPNALEAEHWLLTYEANRQGWLSVPLVAQHPFFQILEQNQVSFYDAGNVLTSFTGPAAGVPGGALAPDYI